MNFNSGIIIDCYKMKAPNTGLYHFCLNLINAIQKRAKLEDTTLNIYGPKKIHNLLPADTYKIIQHIWDEYYLRIPSKYKVWHSTFQLSKFMPGSMQRKVLTIHDLNFLYDRNQRGLKAGIKVLQRNINKSDRLVAISEFTKKDIYNYVDLNGKEVEVIYNGCNTYNGPIITPEKPVTNKPFLFALGTVLAKKNFHVLPCLLQGNEYDLIIAGKISAYANEIIKEASKWGVADRVHLTGPLDESVKHWYLKNCDAFLFPSIAEGFGLPVVEAMYYGKPVFLSNKTALPEIGGSVATYFNDDFDRIEMQQEFQKGMEKYKTTINSEMIKSQALKFSWDNAAEKYWEIYQSLLN